jgi:NADH-quinone oxidoreductase subunit L
VFHGTEKWREVKHDEHHVDTNVESHRDSHEETHEVAHDDHAHHHGLGPNDDPHEPGWVIKLPLILLAIPSLFIGYFAIEPMLYGNFFKGVIFVDSAAHPAMYELTHEWHEVIHSAAGMAYHGLMSLPFLLAFSGVALAWFFYMKRPDIPAKIQTKFSLINRVLENKYYFDSFNEKVFAAGSRFIGNKLWLIGDVKIIDGAIVNGTANLVVKLSGIVRKLQTGLIYHYAFAMIIGVFFMLSFYSFKF